MNAVDDTSSISKSSSNLLHQTANMIRKWYQVNDKRKHDDASVYYTSMAILSVWRLLWSVCDISPFKIACKDCACPYLTRLGQRDIPDDWTSFIQHWCGNIDIIPFTKWKWSNSSCTVVDLNLGKLGPYAHQLHLWRTAQPDHNLLREHEQKCLIK